MTSTGATASESTDTDVRAGTSKQSQASDRVQGILERDAVIGALQALIDAAQAGRGGSIFLAGEAGIGKTTLLALAQEMAAGHLVTAWARGQSMEQSIAFSLMHQCLADLERSLGRGFRTVDSLTAGEALSGATYFRVFDALREISADRPLLLLFDDLHLADAESLSLVSFLVRRTPGTSIAIMAASVLWPPAAVDMALSLANEGLSRTETLRPLSPEGVETVLERYLGPHVDRTLVSQTWAATGGNPMLLHEVGSQLRSGRGLARVGRSAGELGQNLLLARFGALSPPAARVAQAAAILGNQFRVSLLHRVAEPGTDVPEALSELYGSGIIGHPSNGWAQFRHPLFRQALYDDAMPWLRASLHERAFRIFKDLGDKSAAAVHAVAADLVLDDEAASTVEAAGREAISAGAWATAATHLSAAVRLSRNGPSPELLESLGLAQWARGEAVEAVATYQQLLAMPALSDEARATALHMMGRAHLVLAHQAEARALFDEAAGLALARGDAHRAALAQLDEAIAAFHVSGPRDALALADSAVDLAGDDDEDVLGRAKIERALLQLQAGEQVDEEHLAATEGPWVENRAPEDRAWPWGALRGLLDLCLYSERTDDARWAHETAERSAESAGSVPNLISLSIARAQILVAEGDLEGALGVLKGVSGIAGVVPVLAPLIRGLMAYVLQQLGRYAEVAQISDADQREGYWLPTLWLTYSRALHEAAAGHTRSASDLYLELERLSGQVGLVDPSVVPWVRSAVRAHLAAQRPADAERLVEAMEALTERRSSRWPRIVAVSGRALLAAAEGRKTEALELFEELMRTHDEVKGALRLERIVSLTLFGDFLRRMGRPSRSRALLESAVAEADTCGAVMLAGAARDHLAVVSGPRRGFRENPEALTPQEERVVELVLCGRTNSEIASELIVSTRTVETHLGHVYSKLGIRSRNELMARNLGRLTNLTA